MDKRVVLDINQIKCLSYFSRFKAEFAKADFEVVKLMKLGKSREDYVKLITENAQDFQAAKKFKVI